MPGPFGDAIACAPTRAGPAASSADRPATALARKRERAAGTADSGRREGDAIVRYAPPCREVRKATVTGAAGRVAPRAGRAAVSAGLRRSRTAGHRVATDRDVPRTATRTTSPAPCA